MNFILSRHITNKYFNIYHCFIDLLFRKNIGKTFFTSSHKLLYTIILLFILVIMPLTTIHSQTISEYHIKAALLYKFTSFIEWPEDTLNEFVLTILGEDPFGDSFDVFKKHKIKGKKFVIKKTKDIKKIGACHILFISSSEKDNLHKIFQELKKKNILIVGDTEGLIDYGGMINFYNNKRGFVRFIINMEAGEKAGLKISSKLLRLCKECMKKSIRKKNNPIK